MIQSKEKNLIFRIIEYGLEKDVFSLHQLQQDLALENPDMHYINNNLVCLGPEKQPSHIICSVGYIGGNYDVIKHQDCRLLPNAIFQYIDYLEIIETKKMAHDANSNSNMALTIAIYAIIVSVLLGLFDIFLQVIDRFKQIH